MRKRVISLVLAFAMLCAFLPCVASAEKSGKCGDNLTWVLGDDGTLTISGAGKMWSDAFRGVSDVKSVVIENGVTSIGNRAFSECSSLTSINILDSVTSIGGRAFYWCSGLTSVTIPDSVTSIGDSAFEGCTGFPSVGVS